MKPNPTSRLARAALATTLAACLSGTAFATDWVGDVSGDWNDDANWSGDAGTGGSNASINVVGSDASAPYTATITANIVATPVDIFVGNGVGATGLLNHRAGAASTGGGNWMFVGREGATGTYNLADTTTTGGGVSGFAQGSGSMTVGGRLYVGGWGTTGYGEANINTTGTLALGTMLQVGENGGTGVFNLESGTVTVGTAGQSSWVEFGNGGNGANGTLNMTGGSLTKIGNDHFIIASNGGTGVGNLSGGTLSVNNEIWVGQSANSNGTLNISGTAAISNNSWVAFGRNNGTGNVTMTGGTWTKTGESNFIVGASGPGTMDMSGGLVDIAPGGAADRGITWVAETNNCTGTLTLSGTAEFRSRSIIVGVNGGTTGTLNLNGGTVRTSQIAGGNGSATVNINGTQIIGTGNSGTFINNFDSATIDTGGLLVNTNGYALTAPQALTGTGGVVKSGAGALLLTATNTFAGPITVEGGALAGRTTGSLPGWNTPGQITVQSGGALGASLGAGGFSQADFETLLDAADMQAGSSVAISSSLGDLTYATDVSALPTGLGSAVGLHKVGGNTLSIDMSQQTFTGNIISSQGVLRLTNSAADAYAGTITTNGNLRVDGGNGALVLTGAPAGTVNGELWVGSTPDVAANLVLDNTSLAVTSWVALGRGNGDTGTLSSITATNSTISSGNLSTGHDAGLLNDSDQIVTLTDSTWTNNGRTLLAENANATTTMVIEGTSAFNAGARFQIGLGDNSLATVTVKDSATLTKTGGDWVSIGNSGALGTGILNIQDNAVASFSNVDFNVSDVGTSQGTVNISGSGTLNVAGIAFIGKGTGTSGTVNLTGGTFNGGRWIPIGRFNGSTGVVNVSGGTLNQTNTGEAIIVGEEGTGTLTISGTGAVNAAGPAVLISNNATGTGTLNLDGGTLTARQVTAGASGAGSATLNLNGGLLVAGAGANASFINSLDAANVLAGGARIDSNGQVIAIDQALLDGGGGGGLTKTGAGTLILAGNNTYTGATAVTEGTLTVNGSIAASTLTTVDPGATLMGTGTVGAAMVSATAHVAPGNTIGTLNVTGDIDIEGVLDIEYDGLATPTIDVLNVTGILDITDATVDFAQLDNPLTGPVYVFATYGTLAGAEFASVVDLPGGYTIDYAWGGNSIALIPEPSATLLAALGLLALLRRRRA